MAATAGAMFVELTKATRENLWDVEGSLWVFWATAKQVNARQRSNSQSGTFSPRYMCIGITTRVRFLGLTIKFYTSLSKFLTALTRYRRILAKFR